MAKTVLYFWISSMLLLCACQSDPDLTEAEVYTILNEIIVADSLRIHRLCWKFRNLPLYGEHIKVFTEQDKKFIKRQKLLHKGFIIQPNKLKGYSSSRKSFHLVEVWTYTYRPGIGTLDYKFGIPIFLSETNISQ